MNASQISNHKYLFVVSLAIGIILIAVTFLISSTVNVAVALATLGSSLLVLGAFGLIYAGSPVQPTAEKGIGDSLTSNSSVTQFSQLGLAAAYEDASHFDYSQALCDSHQLTIVLNDGRTWLSVHRDRLRKRLQDPTRETTIYLIDPRSEMVCILARKGSIEPDVLRSRIYESIELLKELVSDKSQLEVLGHSLFNPYSLVLTEHCALIVPYFVSRGGRTVPLYVYEDTGGDCYYRELAKDTLGLRMDSKSLLLTRQHFPVLTEATHSHN